MKLTPLCIAIATLAASIASAHAADVASATRQAYLVQLTDAPVAAYSGGVAGLAATKPAAGKQLSQSLASNQVQSYTSYLSGKQNAIQALVASAPVLYRYHTARHRRAGRAVARWRQALLPPIAITS